MGRFPQANVSVDDGNWAADAHTVLAGQEGPAGRALAASSGFRRLWRAGKVWGTATLFIDWGGRHLNNVAFLLEKP